MTDDATTKAPEAQKKGASVAAGVEEETASPYPVMRLAQDMHRLCVAHSTIASNNTPSSSSVDYSTLEAKVWNEIISELENPSLYTLLRDKLYPFLAGEDVDDSKMTNTTTTTPPSVPSSSFVSLTPAQLQAMYDKNAATMLELQAAVARAMESAGDMEVLDARMAIARLAAKSLTCEQALEAYETLLSPPLLLKTNAIPAAAGTMGTTTKNKSISNTSKLTSGKKIDAYMAAARVTCFYKSFDPTPTMQSTDISTPTPASITGASTPDEAAAPSTSYTTTTRTTTEYLEKAYKLAQAGGGADWDRRNRLKVYRAVMQMIHLDRTIAPAAALLADCIATFNATECCTYTEFITYAILTNLLFLGRRNLKAQLLDGPEILSVSSEIPQVIRLVRAFYECDYREYLQAMVDVEIVLREDRFLHPHVAYFMRELHILAYKQFLDSYQSVTLQAMADAFGVSVDFIDFYASRFIAANRISAKIDKYGGVIVSSRPDLRNAQYRELIQNGDLLLNRIQKLARVVDL